MIIKKIINNIYVYIRNKQNRYYFFLNQKNSFNLPKRLVKKSNRMGFTANEYIIYNLRENDPKEYISEYERYQFRNSVIENRIILDNKIVFYHIIKKYANVNLMYAYRIKGIYVSIENEYDDDKIVYKLREIGKIVYKKQNLGGGSGFKLLEYKDGQFYMNNDLCEEKDINNLIQNTDNYLLEEYCVQSDFENSIFPYSVNTIRIITVELKNGNYDVIAALQRIGLDKKKCVDNACAGGLCAEIDIDTGVLSSARSHSIETFIDNNGMILDYDYHPVTKHMLKGLSIPNWHSIIEQVKLIHKKLRFTNIDFIAWDIALTDNGIKIIEANTSCSLDLLQIFQGYRNQAVGIWMKERGYIE